jgi:hypothetical protein
MYATAHLQAEESVWCSVVTNPRNVYEYYKTTNRRHHVKNAR